jgi:hypothetical protein
MPLRRCYWWKESDKFKGDEGHNGSIIIKSYYEHSISVSKGINVTDVRADEHCDIT